MLLVLQSGVGSGIKAAENGALTQAWNNLTFLAAEI